MHAISPKPFLITAALVLLGMTGCETVPYREIQNPVGRPMPSIAVQTRDQASFSFPGYFSPEGAILIVAYTDAARDDALAWSRAIQEQPLPVSAVIAEADSDLIDIEFHYRDGRRGGLPAYIEKEAALPLFELTGTRRPELARVLYVNNSGTVSYFWDGGFHPLKLNELRSAVGRERR